MTKEEANYLSEVMKAYSEGTTIQCRYKDCGNMWYDCDLDEEFNCHDYEFRIKPESKLRPYANVEEFLQAQKEHGPYINLNGRYVMPTNIVSHDKTFHCSRQLYTFKTISIYKWQDGSPCGIMEE